MKNFINKISFVLVLAMILTYVRPIAVTSGAGLPSLRYSSKVIYVGGDITGKYTDNCWIPSQNTSGYVISYKVTEGADIINVTKNGKVTVTGTKIGKAAVTVNYTKSGEEDITAKLTVYVRRNATDVKLTDVSQADLKAAFEVGDELTLKAAKSFVGKSYRTGNYGIDNYRSLVSDQLEIISSNPNIISVDGFKIKAVSAGTATIKVIARQYSTGEETGIQSVTYTVVVSGGKDDVNQEASAKILIAYFTRADNVTYNNNVDAVSRASLNLSNGDLIGNNGILAEFIREEVGGDLFSIQTAELYPLIYEENVDVALNQQTADERPALSTQLDNLNDYDIIFLGYPNWWGDMPMPMYTFLEEYDFTGKTIIPFGSHRGSGFSDTINTIASMCPDATVIKEGFTVWGENMEQYREELSEWIERLDYLFQ